MGAHNATVGMDAESLFDGFSRRDWDTGATGTVRVAMVGLGWWTTDEAMPAVAASERCETTVVVSGSASKAARVAAEHGLAAGLTYEAFREGEASDAYDAVYVCTPNAAHLETAVAAAEMGKHTLCEKPMEASAARAEEMVAAFAGSDAELMVAYRMHTEPAVRRMRDIISEGYVGEPCHVHGHMSQRLLEMIPNEDQWRLDPSLAGSGASLTDLGVYPINTARFVLDADPVAVSAQMTSGSAGFEDVPDERATLALTYEGEVLASISASQNAHEAGHLRIVGTEGEVTLDPCFVTNEGQTLELRRGGVTTEVHTPKVNQMREEFEYFADRVLGGEPIEPDGEHGLHDMRTLEAAYEAAESGERREI